MKRKDLDHILRASKDITRESVFVLVGSQAALAQLPGLPSGAMGVSPEIDIYPKYRPDLGEVIDGAIGQLSTFANTYGYYADGVDNTTASLAYDWETRAVEYSSPAAGGAKAIAPEIHDLAASKLVAGREKDLAWIEDAVRSGLVNPNFIGSLVEKIDGEPKERKDLALQRLEQVKALAPTENDALRVDPAAGADVRATLTKGMDDITLLRRMHASYWSSTYEPNIATKLELLEGYKLLRKEARNRLLYPETGQIQKTASKMKGKPGQGPEL
jgi:hypothetical protein